MAMITDSFEDRQLRFGKAKVERDEKIYLLEQSYRFGCPDRDKWYITSNSWDKSLYWWDSTAVEGVKSFASNFQQMLMPSYQRWFKFISGSDIQGPIREDMDRQLELTTTTLYNILNKSNLYIEANTSIQDMAISTGVLKVSGTGDRANPLIFEAIPTHTTYFEEFNRRIETVFRLVSVPVRNIQVLWPGAKLDANCEQMLASNPNHPMDLLESCVYYPENPGQNKYLYSINVVGGQEDLYCEEMEISPFIAFRFNVAPGETWGFGPVMQALGWIRVINAMTDMELRSAAYKCQKPLMINDNNWVNPFTTVPSPGFPIMVTETRDAIVPLDMSGDLQFAELKIQHIQQMINSMLFANPLGPMDSTEKTATEMEIRQNNWIKRSTASFARNQNELLLPLISKSLYYANKAGLIQGIKLKSGNVAMKVDNVTIDIEFNSPISKIQKNADTQSLMGYVTNLGAIVGAQQAMASLNLPKLVPYLANNFELPQSLFKNEGQIAKMLADAAEAAAQQQAAQAQGAQQADQQQPMQNPTQKGAEAPPSSPIDLELFNE